MTRYIFQFDEVRQRLDVEENVDNNGYWMPSYVPGDIQTVTEGVTGMRWMCNGNQILSLSPDTLQNNTQPWKTYSMFYSGGIGFRVMRGNATNPTDGQAYRPLGFEHHDDDSYSSYLTNVMVQPTLRCQRDDQIWTRMLLPNTYHGTSTTVPQYGGLKGELPIFLALIAFSMPPALLQTYLPAMMHNGVWQQFNMQNGWIPKRGVVVTVYTFQGGSTARELTLAEEGEGQRYYP